MNSLSVKASIFLKLPKSIILDIGPFLINWSVFAFGIFSLTIYCVTTDWLSFSSGTLGKAFFSTIDVSGKFCEVELALFTIEVCFSLKSFSPPSIKNFVFLNEYKNYCSFSEISPLIASNSGSFDNFFLSIMIGKFKLLVSSGGTSFLVNHVWTIMPPILFVGIIGKLIQGFETPLTCSLLLGFSF